MKTLGYLLITAGFLGGSYVAVLQLEGVAWPWFLPWLAVGAAGVAVVQLGIRRESRAADTVASNVQAAADALDRLVESSRRLDAEKESIDTYDVRHAIDERFMGDLDVFVEARESIGHRYGLQAYADVMSHFATAERYLNRCWSASTDGYIDEVHEYLGRAHEQFVAAREQLQRTAAGNAPAGPLVAGV